MVLTELIFAAERVKQMGTAAIGGGILNNIPRKNAILATDAPGRSPFPRGTHGHNEILGYEGSVYPDEVTLRQMSDYIDSDIPPLSNQFNNATLPQVTAMQVTKPGVIVSVANFTRIDPTQKSVLHTSGKHRPVVARTGGPSPHSDTPFHPTKPAPAPVRRARPSPQALRQFQKAVNVAGSFAPTGSVVGHLSGVAHADLGGDRWSTIKKGAAG